MVFDPLVRPTVCDECAAAYAEARRIIEAAGGLRAWAASYDRAFWTPVACVEVEVRVVGVGNAYGHPTLVVKPISENGERQGLRSVGAAAVTYCRRSPR